MIRKPAQHSSGNKLVHEIKHALLDFALVALPISDPGIVELPLFEEPFLCVRHISEKHSPLPAAIDLHGMKLLLLEEGHCFREQALTVCKIPATIGRHELDVSNLNTLIQMVGAGLGITLIPRMAIPVECNLHNVCLTPLADAVQPTRTIGVIWRKGNLMADKFKMLAELISKYPPNS